jgi:hypothetical protein
MQDTLYWLFIDKKLFIEKVGSKQSPVGRLLLLTVPDGYRDC